MRTIASIKDRSNHFIKEKAQIGGNRVRAQKKTIHRYFITKGKFI